MCTPQLSNPSYVGLENLHVPKQYLLRPEASPYTGTLGPKYTLYGHMDSKGFEALEGQMTPCNTGTVAVNSYRARTEPL